MPKPTKKSPNRVCFWLPRPWRLRLLAIIDGTDGRRQGEFCRTAVIGAIERAETASKKN